METIMKEILATRDNTLALQCFDRIQSDIVDGILAPGQKLKVDYLKQEFGVGHSPIREALSRLVASGLVEVQDNKGFRVAMISEQDIRDTYQTFFQIEILALSRAIELGDDVWESGIAAALHHLSLIENKHEEVAYSVWAERNDAFHTALIAGCNSPLLLKIRADVYRRFDRYCRISFSLRRSELDLNHADHKKLAQAVLNRDITKASTLMKHHIFGALESVIKLLKQYKKL